MTSHTTDGFWKLFEALPQRVQEQARTAYRRFQQDPFRLSLRFRQVHATEPIFSVRISRDYRAVGVRSGDDIVWFWIGSHSDYDHLLSQL